MANPESVIPDDVVERLAAATGMSPEHIRDSARRLVETMQVKKEALERVYALLRAKG